MFLFLRLLLAHFVGDFPLQFRFVYSAKVKNIRGKAIHAGIVTATMIPFSYPYWKEPILWFLLAIIGVTHFFQDWAKLIIVHRLKNPNNFFVFLADQILHIATLGVIWLTPLAQQTPKAIRNSFLEKLYLDHTFILISIVLISASFAGTFMIATFKATFLSQKLATPYLEPLERIYGIIERALMILLMIWSYYTVILLPLFLLPKFIYANFQIKRLKGNSFEPFLSDTIAGMIFVIINYAFYALLA